MKDGTILLIASDIEPICDNVVLELRRRGIRPVRLHPADLATGLRMDFSFSDSGIRGRFLHKTYELDIESVRSVWYRTTDDPKLPSALSEDERRFAHRESKTALLGSWSLVPGLWVNSPESIRLANLKFKHLQVARELGLRTPRTLVTNDPDEALRFYESCSGDIVFKTLSQGLWRESLSNVYVGPVSAGQLKDMREQIRACPCVFQERVDKRVELRVTIIGRRAFTAAIHSQELASARYDWRRDADKIRHEVFSLPSEIEERLLGMMDRFGLNYAAADLIVTPREDYVFLDFNPQGQFGWIEQMTGLPLYAAMADLLVAGKRQ